MPRRPNAGRKTLFNENIATQIIGKISKGLSRAKACLYFDITEQTLRNWQKEKPDFFARLKRAEIECEEYHLDRINNGIQGRDNADWKSSAWYLSRKYPDEYSEKVKQEISITIPEPPKPISEMTEDELTEYQQQLNKISNSSKKPRN